MSSYGRNRYIEKSTFGYCRETCPEVEEAVWEAQAELNEMVSDASHASIDALMSRMLAKIKEVGTERLRDALRDAVSDLMDAKGEVADLKAQIDSLVDERNDLLQQLKDMDARECAN